MAGFRKPKADELAPPGGGAATALADPPVVSGQSADECMATGQALVQAGQLGAEGLAAALQEANGDLLRFGIVLLNKHGVGRNELAPAVATACGVPVADSSIETLDEEIVTRFPEEVARKHKVMPIADEGGVGRALRRRPVAGTAPDGRAGHRPEVRVEGVGREDGHVVHRADVPRDGRRRHARRRSSPPRTTRARPPRRSPRSASTTVLPWCSSCSRIVGQALRDRSSDIHIEPLDDRLRIRFRVDGHLVEAFSLPLSAHNALISRLKIMSEMNIVEKRAPQDGQFSTKVDGRPLDVRVASVSTVFGEKIVMRLLDKSKSMVGLGELGMPAETYKTYAKLVHAPFGMVICAGPTGAGKTTTLYATLLEINSTGKNVTTVEDPVEYVFPGINQVQTNVKAGLTFATGLKALLRQDPDVILVGEIRDADTARIAIQSALTGHFVLSSLHGTDSVAALHRLLDMGIEAFLVASAIVGVVSQRLLRKMCDNCKEPYTPGAEELAVFRQHSGGSDKTVFYHGKGCSYCNNTGYRDRIGVYELLRITPEIRRLIVGWATTEELRRLAVAQGMRTMLREAMQMVEDDVTTVPEVVRTLFAH